MALKLNCAVVIHTGYGNAVFRTGQLVLQLQEVGVGFQVRIVFCDHQQAGKRAAQFAVGLAGFGNRLGAA